MQKIPIFVYLNTGITESIYMSQVEPVLKFARANAEKLIHISLEPARDDSPAFKKRLAEVAAEFDTTIVYQSRNLINRHALQDAGVLDQLIEVKCPPNSPVLVHARGLVNSYKAVLLKRSSSRLYRVHADMRGVLWDEATRGSLPHRLLAPYRRRLYLDWERQTARHADTISCVSRVYQEYFQLKYNRPDTEMIPTFVDPVLFNFRADTRQHYRDMLGIANQPVLVFCGGSAYWQNIPEIVDLYGQLYAQMKDFIMLFLTHAPDAVRKLVANRIPAENLRILQVAHTEVPGYLCAADIAVLLRDDIPTNNYAAPTKFGEYLCCGLPVIISPRIGDTEALIRENGSSHIWEPKLPPPGRERLQALLKADRATIARVGAEIYAKERFLSRLLDLYMGQDI